MDEGNHSVVLEFVFLGLSTSREIQLLLFLFSCVYYMASLMGNLLIVLTVTSDPRLQSPMYLLLANLSIIDLMFCSSTALKMIYDLLRECKTISFGSFVAHIFFIHAVRSPEMGSLIAMAFDRYVAICKPLHYLTIMTLRKCILFLVASWIIGLIHSVTQLAFVVDLSFCGPNDLDSFFCDFPWFIKLACTYTSTLGFMVTGFISVASFFILIISYTFILVTIQKKSLGSRSKALSTLSAHVTVVVLFFGPLIFFYVWPFPTSHLDEFLAVFDAVLTPFLSLVIYAFRNKEMKVAMRRLCSQLVK
ncbi:olfactory receptor 4F6-like [Canis lupus baileyi]|uniref:olfactory receptor 4F6-like n=1 Tax=Canis lupus baileyi TaxID=143281 RepID=UPI003B96ECCD